MLFIRKKSNGLSTHTLVFFLIISVAIFMVTKLRTEFQPVDK